MSEPINLLAATGAPDFVTADPTQLVANAVAWFEGATGRTLSPSQVEMYLAEMAGYMLAVRAMEENRAIAQCFIAWASGNYLDAHGAARAMPRLIAQFARATARFERDAAATDVVLIPAGTRFATGNLMLQVTESVVLTVAVPLREVTVEATVAGAAQNGAAVGLLRAVDPVEGLGSAILLTPSAGGTETEADDRYRARLATAFERINRGGSRAAYRSIVMEWSAAVLDAAIIRSAPGHIAVYPLMQNGVPTATERADLLAYLNDGRVPMGDYVTVINPAPYAFGFVLTLLLSDVGVKAQAEAAVTAVLADWRKALGGYVAPSDLILAARSVVGVTDAYVNIALSAVTENLWRNGSFTTVVVAQ